MRAIWYKKRNFVYLLLLVVLAGYYLTTKQKTSSFSGIDPNSVNALLLDEELVYTKHAKCRMDCRYISKSEVEDILRNGKVNWRKSDSNDSPCPSYALEGRTKDGQQVRVVFADCNNATKVVTAIDLGRSYDCVCD